MKKDLQDPKHAAVSESAEVNVSEPQDAQTEPQAFWRSIEDKEGNPTFPASWDYEYTPDAQEIAEYTNVSRRQFLGLMGASAALAGVVSTGCLRKPVERILPYAKRPEELIPGKPLFFATATHIGNAVLGLLVESQDGRPTKVEGNPEHPMSYGATDVWAQSSVLDLYDPDRGQFPMHAQKQATWDALFQALKGQLEKLGKNGGEGLAILSEAIPSPTFHDLLATLKKRLPKSQYFSYDTADTPQTSEGLAMAGAADTQVSYALNKADVLLSIEHDFLGREGDSVRQSRLFAARRKIDKQMCRLYAVEGSFTTTGAAADHRLRLQSSQVGEFLGALVAHLAEQKHIAVDAGLLANLSKRAEVAKKTHGGDFAKWIPVVAEDLVAHKGRAAVMVGESQPKHVHALGALLNDALGNIGQDKPVQFFSKGNFAAAGSLLDLAASALKGQVQTLIILGGNPVYNAPADVDFAKLLQRIPFSLHQSFYPDETAALTTWYAPMSHYLEAWGDLRATDGTTAIRQPLIAPLYDTISEIEMLSFVAGEASNKGHDLVRAYWKKTAGDAGFEAKWRAWLHDGVIDGTREKVKGVSVKASKLADAWGASPEAVSKGNSFELRFVLDNKVHDGRFANNAWLQELPDPMTKLTWDNAALLSPKTAAALGVSNGTWVEISIQGRKAELPAFFAPGIAENTIVLPLGYGRAWGRVSKGCGFNTYPLRSSLTMYHAKGASVKKLDKENYELASTQEHGRLEEPITGRSRKDAIFRELPLAGYLELKEKNPGFMEDYELMPKNKIKSLWKEPNERGGHQWGMTIDLTSCTGCNVCTVACQAENNIPVVGKARVLKGREMHWIRLDRYFTGPVENPEAALQPVACVHCETAPCENVCPVAATAHSPDGMNDIAYNRCIGTRYCANNCPYKVRRFNYFNFNKENDEQNAMLQMQRNPDVTVRFRGVIEKCSYCVQRVSEAKIYAKANGDGFVKDAYAFAKVNADGVEVVNAAELKESVVPACAQACPSQAIVFGDINNPQSRVSQHKKEARDYAVLRELNIRPRTTYLAQIRNRNPKLAPKLQGKAAELLEGGVKPAKAGHAAHHGHDKHHDKSKGGQHDKGKSGH